MTITAIDVTTIEPLAHDEAMRRQAQELDRTLALLRSLDDTAWTAPTHCCPAWDIRAMYQHVLGACEAGASIRENLHQLRRARSHRKQYGGPLEAALSAVQVRERAHLSPAQIIGQLAAIAPKTVRGRSRTPALIRNHAKLAVDGPVHEIWMHRADAARALSQPIELSADHDGRIVADIVAEWARRHGKPFALDLTGPAGGTYAHDPDLPQAEHLSLDAVGFCRTLAGRGHPTGLLTTIVPF